MYGPVRTVVWQGSTGDRRPYADQLQHIRVVLYLSHEGELDPMALELDRDTHLPAWISAADIANPSSDAARRARRPDFDRFRPERLR